MIDRQAAIAWTVALAFCIAIWVLAALVALAVLS